MGQPLISGFTFIKNGLTLGYPIKESIESIEPLCDEIIINVGYDDTSLSKDDGTYEYLRDNFTHQKFRFLKSHWDPALTSRGLILSEQTNIALRECKGSYCQYIQGDEAIHEEDLAKIHAAVMDMEERPEIEGLIFNYLHFYGNTDVIKYTRSIYRREVRLIRNHLGIKSWLDAQGFRHADERKIHAKQVDARILHYGWARKEQVMANKVNVMNTYYHGKDVADAAFKYERIWGLKPFLGTHPAVMKNWVQEHHNDLDILALPLRSEWKNVGLAISDLLERLTGYRMGEYRNYIEIV